MNGLASISRKSQHLNIPDLGKLHSDCKNWLSELAFWRDEIEFLKSIPYRYIEKITDENHIINLKFLMGKLNGELSDELCSLEDKVVSLETMIAGLVQNSFVFDEQTCRKEHNTLRIRIESYRDAFEDIKEEVKELVKNAFRISK